MTYWSGCPEEPPTPTNNIAYCHCIWFPQTTEDHCVFIIGHREIKLGLTWKLLHYRQAFMKLGSTVQTIRREKVIVSPSTT